MKKRRLPALLLALALLCSGCMIVREPTAPVTPVHTPLQLSPVLETATPPDEIRYDALVYTPGDAAWFRDQAEALRTLLDGEDEAAALALYDALYQAYGELLTNNTLIYLRYCENVLDSEVQAEMLRSDELLYEVDDLLRAVTRDALASDFAQAFADYIGTDYIQMLETYTDVDERELALNTEITELTNRYNEQMLGDEIYYEKDGVRWTYSMLQSDAIYQLDSWSLYEVYYGLMDALNAAVGQTYLQLVELRQELAALNGYDNYLEYAYAVVYGRDYGPDYAQALQEAVKTWIAPRFFELAEANSALLVTGVDLEQTEQTMLRLLRQGIAELPESVTEALDYMERCGLFYYTDDAAASSGAFTTLLAQYGAPFLYMRATDPQYDLQTTYHEFGHYLSSYYNRPGSLLGSSMNIDVAEIHSTGMEMLMIDKYDTVFADPQQAQAAAFQHWYSLISTLISGCIEDEFQQYVYTTDETLTVERLNEKYCEIYRSYGYDYGYNETEDTDWMLIPHTFESPLYYISYAMSVLPTFDLWYTAQQDRDAAIETYLSIVSAGCYDIAYLDLLDACGIRSFTDEAYFSGLCDALLDHMAALASAA